jgi:hypothetical protein
MTDDPAGPILGRHCTWCSAALPDPQATTCPSCGATLVVDAEPQLPGVTALDADAIIRAARAPLQRPRSRILSWIAGDYEDDDPGSAPAPPGSLAPPPPDVQREMLRLELAAEVANLEAEAESIVAEAEVEAREAGRAPAPRPLVADAESDDIAAADSTAESEETATGESTERSTPA